MGRLKKQQIPIYDRDGVLINEESYPGIELARKKMTLKFEERLHSMFSKHTLSRPTPEVLAAIFFQGMAFGITQQTDTKET